MKRLMLQLFRTIVTVVVVGTMAVMIFTQRAELQKARARAAAAEATVRLLQEKLKPVSSSSDSVR